MAQVSMEALAISGGEPVATSDALPPFEALAASAGDAVPAPTPVANNRITVRVGEGEFFTTQSTLRESRLFADLFSREPERTQYFIDNDAALFGHVLRFLRTRRFPLFYDRTTGHDGNKYAEVLAAARFYKVTALETWLATESYLGAVCIKSDHKLVTLYGQNQIEHMEELVWKTNQQAQVLAVREKMAKAWLCPLKIWRHDGKQSKCYASGCLSGSTRDHAVCMVVMRIADVSAVVTSVEIREQALRSGRDPEAPPPYQF